MLTNTLETEYLARRQNALKTAHDAVKRFAPGTLAVKDNGGRDVITLVDRAVSDLLHTALPKGHEGWFSEEDVTTLAACRNKLSGWWIPSMVPVSLSMTFPSGASRSLLLSTAQQ